MPWGGHEEGIDAERVKAEFGWLLDKGRPMVISPDLDGLASGLLLAHVFDWQLVGFYDGKALAAVPPYATTEPTEAVYVDHDVSRLGLASIGHHMLVWSDPADAAVHTAPQALSLNPNLMRAYAAEKDFERKYPLGTWHLLAALVARLEPERAPVLTPQGEDAALEIDSSLGSSLKYPENVLAWLEWLKGGVEGGPLRQICEHLQRLRPAQILSRRQALADAFRALGFGWAGPGQCRFGVQPNKARWASVCALARWLGQVMGHPQGERRVTTLQVEALQVHKFTKTKADSARDFKAVLRRKPLSYAITAGGTEGLSYTL